MCISVVRTSCSYAAAHALQVVLDLSLSRTRPTCELIFPSDSPCLIIINQPLASLSFGISFIIAFVSALPLRPALTLRLIVGGVSNVSVFFLLRSETDGAALGDAACSCSMCGSFASRSANATASAQTFCPSEVSMAVALMKC